MQLENWKGFMQQRNWSNHGNMPVLTWRELKQY